MCSVIGNSAVVISNTQATIGIIQQRIGNIAELIGIETQLSQGKSLFQWRERCLGIRVGVCFSEKSLARLH